MYSAWISCNAVPWSYWNRPSRSLQDLWKFGNAVPTWHPFQKIPEVPPWSLGACLAWCFGTKERANGDAELEACCRAARKESAQVLLLGLVTDMSERFTDVSSLKIHGSFASVSRLPGLGWPVPLIVVLPPSRLLDSSTCLGFTFPIPVDIRRDPSSPAFCRPLHCSGFGFSPCQVKAEHLWFDEARWHQILSHSGRPPHVAWHQGPDRNLALVGFGRMQGHFRMGAIPSHVAASYGLLPF